MSRKKDKLCESDIVTSLWNQYGRNQTACNNIYYYPFESDLLILRDSGTVIEYEVKLSVADYKADFKKQTRDHKHAKDSSLNKLYSGRDAISRHRYLLNKEGANMFYYVAPRHVFDEIQVPEWAGKIEARPSRYKNHAYTSILRQAKKLHKKKADDKLEHKILRSIYYKYWKYFANQNIHYERSIKRSN